MITKIEDGLNITDYNEDEFEVRDHFTQGLGFYTDANWVVIEDEELPVLVDFINKYLEKKKAEK